MSRAPLSIVIPTRNRPAMLIEALATVAAAAGPHDEVIVVDSASSDGTTLAAAAGAGVQAIRSERSGASVARNLGWRAARNDLIAFIDDDVRVAPDWADAMVAALERPGVGFVTGQVGIPPGQEGTAVPVATLSGDEAKRFTAEVGEHPGHSANLGIHRRWLERVGGFDEHLGPGRPFIAEDVDLFDRLLIAGCEGRYDPTVQGWHEQWRSRWDRVKLDWSYGKGAGARMAKLARTDRRRMRVVGHEVVVKWGFSSLASDVKARNEYLSLCDAVRLAGMAAGFGRGLAIPLRGGHFQPRRDRYAP